MPESRQFAVVTGASTGIGLELARCCVRHGFDVLIAADEPEIERAASELRAEASGKIELVRPIFPRRKASISSIAQRKDGRSIF